MSGLEIAGLVSGIIPLLQLAFGATKALKTRLEDFHLSTRKIGAIENTLNKISHHLQELYRQYENHQLDIPPHNASIIETNFNHVAATLEQVAERFANISRHDHLSRWTLRGLFNDLTLIISNKRTSICNDTITQLNEAFERLFGINHVLVGVNSAQCISKTQDNIMHQLKSLGIVNNNTSESQDTYTPSFYVPTNPPIANECLDYASVNSEGNALTSEGKLKAHLLHLINKRQETHDTLPVVGAVGMSGTGKTCALRGLKAEKDLKELFPDGILFLFCGPSASNEGIKQALCSLVSQTGGRALSQEMKQMKNASTIDVIIEKVSNWFKHKKCLFLVDDVWNTTATGSSLLSKLVTVVGNCDMTSGLVYTTRDERIDIFDSAVRFECLPPDSPACCNILARAAGVSLEQIDQADQEQAFDMILKHCKGLKFALVVAGREVWIRTARYGEHREQAWDSYANALRDFPHQLLTQNYAEYDSLHFQFSVSLQTLGSQESHNLSFPIPYRTQEMFQALCVAEKGDVLYDSMLYRLWGLESIQQARAVSKLFADVSLVETTIELIEGRFSEGIRVHDLVHDYAIFLSDQHYVDRNWIKGWEVWGLRLLECYCGTDEQIASSCSTFVEWWDKEEASRQFSFEGLLNSVIYRIAFGSRIRSGQDLLEHRIGVDRFFDMTESATITWVGVCFTLRKSTVVEMHEFVTIMAREREVVLSNLTVRMLIFAALLNLRLKWLLASNVAAAELAEKYYSLLCTNTNEEAYRHRACIHLNTRGLSESSMDEFLVPHAYLLPANLVKCMQTSVALNWTFYDNCFEGPEIDDDEHYRTLGVPMTYEKLGEAQIESIPCLINGVYPSDFLRSEDLLYHHNGVFEFINKHNYTCIPTPFVAPFDDECSPVDPAHPRYLHLHLHEVTNDACAFNQRKKLAVAETYFGTPLSMTNLVRTQRGAPARLEGQ